jgi:heptosyltransferase-1
VELAQLAAGAGYTVWLPWGGPDERERAERIAAQAPSAEVLPRLDLRGLAGMLLEVQGAVAVDTGLGHLAAALNVPMVSLYGPTSVKLVGAYGRNQVSLQSPLHGGDTRDPATIMAAIEPTQVWQELQPILPERA